MFGYNSHRACGIQRNYVYKVLGIALSLYRMSLVVGAYCKAINSHSSVLMVVVGVSKKYIQDNEAHIKRYAILEHFCLVSDKHQ